MLKVKYIIILLVEWAAEHMKKLNAVDTLFLTMESHTTPMHISGLATFKIPDDYDGFFCKDIVAGMLSCDDIKPPFDMHIETHTLSLPTIEKVKDFDISDHIRHVALPQPGNKDILFEMISRLQEKSLDRSRPLWELYVVEGLEDNRMAIFVKIHHSLVDGKGFMQFLHAGLSHSPDNISDKLLFQNSHQQNTKEEVSWSDGLLSFISDISDQAKSLPDIAKFLVEVTGNKLLKKSFTSLPFEAPKSFLNQKISGHRKLVSCEIPLSKLTELSKRAGCTINDLALCICSNALRQYMLVNDVMEKSSLIALLPVALPKIDSQGNSLSSILCEMGTNISEPTDCLRKIYNSTSESKRLLKGMSQAAQENINLINQGPFVFLESMNLSSKFKPSFNLIVTNVPGPKDALYLNGAKLESVSPIPFLCDGHGLMIAITGSENSVEIGMLACPKSVPNVESITESLPQMFDQLEASIDQQIAQGKWSLEMPIIESQKTIDKKKAVKVKKTRSSSLDDLSKKIDALTEKIEKLN